MKWIQIGIASCLYLLSTTSNVCLSQISTAESIVGQYWSKELTEYKAKEYLATQVLKLEDKKTEYLYIDALTASGSGELTTVVYQSNTQSISGLILAFYNDYITKANTPFDMYGFKNLDLNSAIEFLDLIETNFNAMVKINKSEVDDPLYESVELTTGNDLVFRYDDLIVYIDNLNTLRIFWNGYDSAWDYNNFTTLKRRVNKLLKKGIIETH